jgi:hypothetical protein
MTTQLTTLERIIKEIKELNEFDGETVEYLLEQIGYEDYVLRHLMMNEPISNIENHYEERIEFERDNNNNIIKNPLVHRLEMVKDDIIQIEAFIKQQGLSSDFELPSSSADSCFTHIANINIACDLTSEEALNWGEFRKREEENPEEQSISTEWRDIRNLTMEAKSLCLEVWNRNRDFTRKYFLQAYKVTTIELILIVHEVWNDIENNDTLTFNNFEDYWRFFIANRNKSLSL